METLLTFCPLKVQINISLSVPNNLTLPRRILFLYACK
jgi:hypothetical protein